MDRLKIKILAIVLFFCTAAQAQELQLPVLKANVYHFRGAFYCFGFDPSATSKVKIYKADSNLIVRDSLLINVRQTANHYSRLTADSLHGSLQIYGSNEGGSGAFIVRIGNNFSEFELVTNIENTRLNSLTLFTGKKFIAGKAIYDIEERLDSSGTQYFLDKYVLMNDKGNYEYKKQWQFPFDKKDIEQLYIIHSDTQSVYLYVHRNQEDKGSQWLIKISAKTGTLQKASKIGGISKNDYRLAHCYADMKTGKLILLGQEFAFENSSKQEALWFCEVDTSGSVAEMAIRNFTKPPATKAQKNNEALFISVNHARINHQKHLELDLDLFQKESDLCMRYAGSQLLIIKNLEIAGPLNAGILSPQAEVNFYYSSLDKLDLNAKICFKTASELLHCYPLNRLGTGRISASYLAGQIDSYLLSKAIVRKNQVSFDYFVRQKNGLEQKNLCLVNFEESPQTLVMNAKKLALGTQKSPEIYVLKIFNW